MKTLTFVALFLSAGAFFACVGLSSQLVELFQALERAIRSLTASQDQMRREIDELSAKLKQLEHES